MDALPITEPKSLPYASEVRSRDSNDSGQFQFGFNINSSCFSTLYYYIQKMCTRLSITEQVYSLLSA